jgi:hypothetical protein
VAQSPDLLIGLSALRMPQFSLAPMDSLSGMFPNSVYENSGQVPFGLRGGSGAISIKRPATTYKPRWPPRPPAKSERRSRRSGAEVKHLLSRARLRLRGLARARDEFLLIPTVQNLKSLAYHSAIPSPPPSATQSMTRTIQNHGPITPNRLNRN